MKKQKIAFFLNLAWLVGIAAVFSFPPSVDLTSHLDSDASALRSISTPDLLVNLVDHSQEVPAFKANLGFSDLVGSEWNLTYTPFLTQYLAPSFFSKSKALFDVLITFFYFYHTW